MPAIGKGTRRRAAGRRADYSAGAHSSHFCYLRLALPLGSLRLFVPVHLAAALLARATLGALLSLTVIMLRVLLALTTLVLAALTLLATLVLTTLVLVRHNILASESRR